MTNGIKYAARNGNMYTMCATVSGPKSATKAYAAFCDGTYSYNTILSAVPLPSEISILWFAYCSDSEKKGCGSRCQVIRGSDRVFGS
jgi:hypothetical protein